MIEKPPRCASFVPLAVSNWYQELVIDKKYSEAERACWGRLVSDQRMEEVYNSLRLSDDGWRLFLYLACYWATVDVDAQRKRRERVYELLNEIEDHSGKLSKALTAIETLAVDLVRPALFNIDTGPFENTLDLLREATPDAATFETDIAPRLTDINDTTIEHAIPTPAQMVETLGTHAAEIARLSASPLVAQVDGEKPSDAGRLQFSVPALNAAAKGRQSSPLPNYRRGFIAAAKQYQAELSGVDGMSDQVFAALASVALNRDISADAVKKLRQRDN